MAQVIPVTIGESNQKITTAIDNETYVLRVRWNTRDAAWYLDAWERDGTTAIALSVKIVVGIMLGATVQHPLFMPGLFAFDTSGEGIDPGLNDLGGRVQLIALTMGDRVLLGQSAVS